MGGGHFGVEGFVCDVSVALVAVVAAFVLFDECE